MIDLLVLLQRHEHTAAVASEQMSPHERGTLQMQLALVRDTIPKHVLGHYERLKQSEPVLEQCPAALAMATLVSVYRALPRRKRQRIGSFFDLAGYPARCQKGMAGSHPLRAGVGRLSSSSKHRSRSKPPAVVS